MKKADAPLALTMGEPGGVCREITVKAWQSLRASGPSFFVIADPALFASGDTPIKEIDQPFETLDHFASFLPVLPIPMNAPAQQGIASADTAQAVIESINRAVAFALSGDACAVVTNPIQKSALMAGGFSFPGHTEYLEHLSADIPMMANRTKGAVMMLAGPQLRTVPVTVHLSVKEAVKALRPDHIIRTAMITNEALKHDFGIENPRLAISGLNPHAGEDGMLGLEDGMIIAPAIDELKARGVDVRGPLPADTMFHEEARARYDAALCMLHDQALIPAKTLAFHDGVNVTLGLPFVRTSPDHGTALDIAGKDEARADSLIAALRLAADMSARRLSS